MSAGLKTMIAMEMTGMIYARADGGGVVLFIIFMIVVAIVNWIKKLSATGDERPSVLTTKPGESNASEQGQEDLAKFLESLGVPSPPRQQQSVPPVIAPPQAGSAGPAGGAARRKPRQSAGARQGMPRSRAGAGQRARTHGAAAMMPAEPPPVTPQRVLQLVRDFPEATAPMPAVMATIPEPKSPFSRDELREAILTMEILGKPVALRQLQQQGISPICVK